MYNDAFLEKKLQERTQQQALRTLRLPEANAIDFCSNDYLGIVKNNLLSHAMIAEAYHSGSTGSRLLSGNYPLIEKVETQLAAFHQAEAALTFNSGYDANASVLASIPERGDTILYDQLCHASIRDGIRLSFAQSFSYAHNDIATLEKKLSQQNEGNVFVVTESVFSMDGDIAPLKDIVAVCDKYKAHLIVDEAHATGIIGSRGEGLVQHLNLSEKIFCRIHTFGKAAGCYGAVTLGTNRLKQYLINFARGFIYSTALPEHAVACIKKSYEIFPGMHNERMQLQRLTEHFQSASIPFEKLVSHTPIQIVIVPGNDAVNQLAATLQHHLLDVRAIRNPTVAKGRERLRIVLHAYNTVAEVDKLVAVLQSAGI